MKSIIGILGGIGPESSAKFYELLINKVQSQKIKSNTEYPHIILESIPAPELLLKNPDLTLYKEGMKNLQKSGANFIVIVCNTAYTFIDEFKKIVNIPIIDLRQETESILQQNKVKSITIFGSKKSVNTLFNFKNIIINKPQNNDLEIIDNIIMEYNCGKNKEKLKHQFINILKKYAQQNILIACTELSSILKGSDLKYFDTFEILLDATFNRWNK